MKGVRFRTIRTCHPKATGLEPLRLRGRTPQPWVALERKVPGKGFLRIRRVYRILTTRPGKKN